MATAAQRTRRRQLRTNFGESFLRAGIAKSAAATLDAPDGHAGSFAGVDSQFDIAAILSARAGRRPGRLYKRGNNTYLDTLPASAAATDRGAMSATFCISTPRPDREDDVIVPEGVIFDDYRLNPLVLWEHGFSTLTMPIGTSEDPGGNLAISVTPQGIDATCFFSQSLLEANQLFELVDEGILRAASIHVDPIDAVVRMRSGAGDRPGLLVKTSSMLEWSICGLGCNPDAVRKTLSANRLAGKPISESITKCLRVHSSPTPAVGRGWSPDALLLNPSKTVEPAMAKTLSKDADAEEMEKRRKSYEENDEVKRLRKDFEDAKGDDDEAKSKRKSIVARMKSLAKDAGLSEDDANIPDEPGQSRARDAADGDPDGGDAETPLGAQILGAAYSALSEVADQIEQATRPLENPQVKDYMGSMTDALRGHMAEMNDLHKSEYPDHPELAKDDAEPADGDGAGEPAEASGMVKFLARSKTHRMGLKGIAHELMKVGGSRHMPKALKDRVNQMSRRLASISKAAEVGAKSALTADDEKRYDALEKKIEELTGLLEGAIPHRR